MRGRFAPSPTGPLHLGNLRTALAAWLAARAAGSAFVVRIEDLDPVASREEWVTAHLDDLAVLGLAGDGPVVRQSDPDRRAAHAAALARLDAAGLLYPCFCTRAEIRAATQAPHGEGPEGAYPGTCRDLSAGEAAERTARLPPGRGPAWRLRAAGAVAEAHDRRLGTIRLAIDDMVVRRGDGVCAYNLAVVVDDAAQGIEEVVRGDDLWPGTPRQVHLARLLDLPVPAYAHVPLVLGPDGQRLAKRHGAVTLADAVAAGATPARVLGRLAAGLGLVPPGTIVEDPWSLVDAYDPDRLPRTAGPLPD